MGDPVAWAEFSRALASADLDVDGFADLVVLTTRRIVVLFGGPWGLRGRSELVAPPLRGSQNMYLNAVVVGDFDGDRIEDVAVSTDGPLVDDHGLTGHHRVLVFRGSTAGFDSAPSLEFSKEPPGFADSEHSVGRGLAAGDERGWIRRSAGGQQAWVRYRGGSGKASHSSSAWTRWQSLSMA